ncbi:MAG: alpha/beta hydrolase-fold protein [Chloroherpetonaceae bacterium]|nr:alpha/beta hydrolase-fold protein [Chloroherpetonaceae bacterium]MDW8437688.1 alpha/beta hydrolase-fold protein [Chloroherpetonaceae bacterium]
MPFHSYFDFRESLFSIASLRDAELRAGLLDALWVALRKTEQIPFKLGPRVAFLYKGEAQSVHWHGDFNAWGHARSIDSRGERVGKSDIWILERELPRNARIDYKIVVDGQWMLDPMNPHQCKSGFGKSSELRMPDYEFPTETLPRDDVAKGTLHHFTIQSKHLGYDVEYVVYLPHHYRRLQKLPVIYATDGYEYLDDEQGALRVTLDNLIHDKKIAPVMCVFIDPRNPHNKSENRRLKEYPMNEQFGKFVAQELIPTIDASFKTNPSPKARVILGTSMGGLCAGYFGVAFSSHFNLLAIQSPSFWNKPELFAMYRKAKRLPLKIYLSTGVIYDSLQKTREMRDLFIENDYALYYRETNESHSWGNWRGRLPEMLYYFFGLNKHQVIYELPDMAHQPKPPHLQNKTAIKFNFAPKEPIEHATMKLYDIYGNELFTAFNERKASGFYSYDCAELGLKRGLYFYALKSPSVSKFKMFSVR